MQGRSAEGLRWMGERAAYWTGAGPSSTHVWWHLALYHLELGDARHALELYDRRIAAAAAPSLSELIDASALLWRLELRGVEPGPRWRSLAERWAPHAEDAFCAFNDLHAMLAFVGARRRRPCAGACCARSAGGSRTAAPTRQCCGRWDCPPAGRSRLSARRTTRAPRALLRGLPEVSHRLGGSHAQRGLIGLTLREAERKIGTDPIISTCEK